MDERIFFVIEKNRLMTLKQYEAKLNRLSPVRRLLNRIIYNSNMKYAELKIWQALKKGQPVCYLEYHYATDEEIKDIIARLEYMGYNVNFSHFYSEIRVRLDGN